MRRCETVFAGIASLALVVYCFGTAAPGAAQESPAPSDERAGSGLAARWASLNDPQLQHREPFKIFDNLYYVGIGWVSCYLLTTSDGHVLIDALYGDFVETALDGVRKLGFDPADIKYVLVTHGHFDHVGGAKKIQDLTGARIGMTEEDWKMTEATPRRGPTGFEPPRRDLVIQDGDTLTLGDTEIKLYLTPGHTPGVLSLELPVRDGDRTHKAFTFGGVGLNFTGVDRTRMYLASVKRIQSFSGLEVNVPNHASMGRVFERAEELAARRAGDPHPFVDPEGFKTWLSELLANGTKKLEEELEKAATSAKGKKR